MILYDSIQVKFHKMKTNVVTERLSVVSEEYGRRKDALQRGMRTFYIYGIDCISITLQKLLKKGWGEILELKNKLEKLSKLSTERKKDRKKKKKE